MTHEALYTPAEIHDAVLEAYGPMSPQVLDDIRGECGTLGMEGQEVERWLGTFVSHRLADKGAMTSEERPQMAELKARLIAQGVDVDALLEP